MMTPSDFCGIPSIPPCHKDSPSTLPANWHFLGLSVDFVFLPDRKAPAPCIKRHLLREIDDISIEEWQIRK
jgi:hypothetical protein